MTEKNSYSKLKSVLYYESDSENEVDDDDVDLDLSLCKLNLGPNKKLLVLCLGGLLVHRAHLKGSHSVRGLRPDIRYGNFLVFKRPFCTDFLNFCFQRFDVALWSSAREHNIEGVLSRARNKFVFVWNQEECTDSGYGCLHKKQKPLFLQRMKDLWENKSYREKYSASNTLLIDDEPHTALLNPPDTAIFPQPYKATTRRTHF
ncbi:haloacid dehalogenase-like hydrolase superfamily protein [Striga asiatica]|uniref:Mitochondrial import inner membrane translocase subunit TIM50 n=1 Tax=Striga asiatica TaxID=4170 RepID=A0A5A7PLE7_STRAF|nr:haloacid dehalogenase-like hydrolase superfamily protein [Striga asiatica]